jgi:hypothetical protein
MVLDEPVEHAGRSRGSDDVERVERADALHRGLRAGGQESAVATRCQPRGIDEGVRRRADLVPDRGLDARAAIAGRGAATRGFRRSAEDRRPRPAGSTKLTPRGRLLRGDTSQGPVALGRQRKGLGRRGRGRGIMGQMGRNAEAMPGSARSTAVWAGAAGSGDPASAARVTPRIVFPSTANKTDPHSSVAAFKMAFVGLYGVTLMVPGVTPRGRASESYAAPVAPPRRLSGRRAGLLFSVYESESSPSFSRTSTFVRVRKMRARAVLADT